MTTLAPTGPASMSLCTFRVAERCYGIEVSLLREISTRTDITRIPQAPPVVRGLLNLRSRVILVLDARPLLELSSIGYTVDSRLLVLKPEAIEDAGILVDGGGDIIPVPGDRIEVLERGASERSLVWAVCKMDRELVSVLDPRRLEEVVRQSLR